MGDFFEKSLFWKFRETFGNLDVYQRFSPQLDRRGREVPPRFERDTLPAKATRMPAFSVDLTLRLVFSSDKVQA